MRAKDLMTRQLITVKPTDTLGKVVRLLSEKNISGCPVVSAGRLVGVVTQTDIVSAVDAYGKINKNNLRTLVAALVNSDRKSTKSQLKGVMKKKVREFMNSGVVHIGESDDIYKAANLISRHKVDRLPVVRNGRLIGILTKADIVKALEKSEN